MILTFNSADHYWIVAGSATQVYSSARAAYVAVADATYQTWLGIGKLPTKIASEAELWDVLLQQYPAGLSVTGQAVADTEEPLLSDLKAQADAAITANDTYLAIGTPTTAQAVAQVRALTQQNQRLIKSLKRIVQLVWH